MRTLVLTLVLTTAVAGQSAVNFSGKWIIPGGRGGGSTLTLNQVGTDVAGDLVGGGGAGGGSTAPVNNEIYDGKAEGTTISFYVWRGTDKPAKTFYRGTMNTAGDEITFTITGGTGRSGGGQTPPQGAGGTAAAPQPIVARRAK